jgi:carbamoyl-phosphate synthase large subunit
MALSARCGQQAASLLRQRCLVESRAATLHRSFSTFKAATPRTLAGGYALNQRAAVSVRSSHQLRLFSAALHRLAQDAPDAKSYLASGAVSQSSDLVDVKKVLVIGSGGLSIGQAGEFDYSGLSPLE